MRVLFLSAANSVHTVRWVNALTERGCKVVLVSEKNHQAKEEAVSDKVKIIYLPFGGVKGYYLNAPALQHIYKSGKFDVINVHYASGYGTLARMAKLPDIILNVWGSDVYDFPYESQCKKLILRKNLAYAGKLVSTSYSMVEQTEKFLAKKRKIAVTPFGVDIKHFKPKKSVKTNKEDRFVFGIVKTLSPKYGVATVIKAFKVFVQQLPQEKKEKVRLEIYGKGELLDNLKVLAAKYHMENQIFFGGYVENRVIPSLLNQMDVFILGSKNESFGVAAVEAMACELPVVATSVSGFKEVIEDGKTGFLVPVGDYKEMAEKMFILYDNARLRESMGKEGRKRVEKLYHWEKNVDEMMRVYREKENYNAEKDKYQKWG